MQFTHKDPIDLPELQVEQDATGTRFYITPDGDKYPSITTVLGALEKPWLEKWKKMLGDEKAKKESDRARARGDAIHEMIERYIKNDDPEQFRRQYDQQNVKGFNQVRPLLNRLDNIDAQEVALYSDTLQCAGRVDLVGEYQGELSIVDFKTSNNPKSEEMVQDYYLQGTAYAIMWHELTGQPIENVTIIMSVQKGLVPLVFTTTIDKYVKPLLKRIGDYNGT